MSRSFSLAGLPKSAYEFIKNQNLRVIGEHEFKEHFYSDGYACKIYEDTNGQIFEEFEAGTPWDGGPTLYLGLKNKTTGIVVSTWTQSQMGFSEEIILNDFQKNIIDQLVNKFVTKEDTPNVKGETTLYVSLENTKAYFWQDLISEYPNYRYYELTLTPHDFMTIRDYLSQLNYHVHEMENFSSWKENWDRFLKGNPL